MDSRAGARYNIVACLGLVLALWVVALLRPYPSSFKFLVILFFFLPSDFLLTKCSSLENEGLVLTPTSMNLRKVMKESHQNSTRCIRGQASAESLTLNELANWRCGVKPRSYIFENAPWRHITSQNQPKSRWTQLHSSSVCSSSIVIRSFFCYLTPAIAFTDLS